MLDLFDIVVSKLFTDAAAVGKRARLRSIRDLDAAALRLRRATGVLMDDTVEDGAVREAAFAIVPRNEIAEALAKIDEIVRPPGDLYFAELRAQNARTRFVPGLLRSVALGATPAGKPVLDAVKYLRLSDARRRAASAPLGFVPMGWKRQVLARDGSIDATGYRLCVLESMRAAIRRPRPVRGTEPPIRRPAPRVAERPGLGSGASGHLPHARPVNRRGRGDRVFERSAGRGL